MQERNYGIDFLRIISMFMIVILHILGNGGILASVQTGSVKYHLTWFMEIASYCAVNCYALISGYVGIYSKHKLSNIFYLWIQVIFYTLSITLLFKIISPASVTTTSWLDAFFPITHKQYWYFTAYFCMYFFTPYFNHILNTFSKKLSTRLCLTMFIFLSLLPTFTQNDIFQTSFGYSFLWLSVLYFAGGYIHKYFTPFPHGKHKFLLLYPLCIIITWIMQYIIDSSTFKLSAFFQNGNPFLAYTSPTIVISAISLFLFFSNMQIHPWLQKAIKCIAPLSFSVYLIHTQSFFWYAMTNRFISYVSYSTFKLILSIILTAIIIYSLCSIIDLIRKFIFQLLHIQNFIKRIDKHFVL